MFKSIFKDNKKNEPEFVTTYDFNSILERLLLDSRVFITLVSPYIKFNAKIFDILQQKYENNVIITIIHREDYYNKIANFTYKRSNLHAKCYLTENAFLIGSMNLYDYSQTNNDEFGIYITKNDFPITYQKCYAEVERLKHNYIFKQHINNNKYSNMNNGTLQQLSNDNIFVIGNKYTYQQISNKLSSRVNIKGGINIINNNIIVLIWNTNSRYNNKEIDGTIYYVGQTTGAGKQQLLYGNKALFDAYNANNKKIYLFKNSFYKGEVFIKDKPYYENDQLIFKLQYMTE